MKSLRMFYRKDYHHLHQERMLNASAEHNGGDIFKQQL